MDKRFADVKVLIWDFDGTLYQSYPDLHSAVRQAEYKTITIHTGWTYDKAIAKFAEKFNTVTPSATEVVSLLCHIPTAVAAVEIENYFDRRKYLGHDQKLIELFEELRSYRHFILANGSRVRLEETLITLGLDKNIFAEIVTSEIVGVNKPHEEGFKYILDKTKLPPGLHLMIGDREKVDLVPAKILGMKTCLVWSDVKSDVADITLPTVYDLARFLL